MVIGATAEPGGPGIAAAGPLPPGAGPPGGRRRYPRPRLPVSAKVIAGMSGLAAFLVLAVIGPWIAPDDPGRSFSSTASFPQPPSAAHLLGTTQQQDVLSQLLAGGRSTVLVAFVAGLVATAVSVVIGVTAGYAAGLADDLLSMLANFFLVLPALPLLIVIFGFLRSAQAGGGGGTDVLIGLIIAITGWTWGARVLRAQTLSLRRRDYVQSARVIGERSWRIIGSEILPNLIPVVASSFLFTVLYGVGTYTALAFLGLVNPNHLSWGGMLFYAQVAGAEQSGYWWLFLPPGLAVALLGTSLALVNFGIDEFINPRLRAAGLSRRQARRAGTTGLPRRFAFGVTPVARPGGHRDQPGAARAGAGAAGHETAGREEEHQ